MRIVARGCTLDSGDTRSCGRIRMGLAPEVLVTASRLGRNQWHCNPNGPIEFMRTPSKHSGNLVWSQRKAADRFSNEKCRFCANATSSLTLLIRRKC